MRKVVDIDKKVIWKMVDYVLNKYEKDIPFEMFSNGLYVSRFYKKEKGYIYIVQTHRYTYQDYDIKVKPLWFISHLTKEVKDELKKIFGNEVMDKIEAVA